VSTGIYGYEQITTSVVTTWAAGTVKPELEAV